MVEAETDARHTATVPTWGLFPPYGFINQGGLAQLAGHLKPRAWKGDQSSYRRWFDDTLSTIKTVLWPEYLQEEQRWDGPAERHMLALTRADFDIMRKSWVDFPEMIDLPVTAPSGTIPLRSHRDFFESEDLSISAWGTLHTTYDSSWSDGQMEIGRAH